MHTNKKDGPLKYLPKALLYHRNLVTECANSTFNKEPENKIFTFKVAEVHYEFPLSVLSLFVSYTQVLI